MTFYAGVEKINALDQKRSHHKTKLICKSIWSFELTSSASSQFLSLVGYSPETENILISGYTLASATNSTFPRFIKQNLRAKI